MVRATRAHRWALSTATALALAATLVSAGAVGAADASTEPETPAVEEPMPGPQPWTGSILDEAAAVTGGHDMFVVVGNDGQFPPHAAAWTSSDGLSWEPTTVQASPDGTHMSHVVATDGGFVAMGTSSSAGAVDPEFIAAWSSPDGMTWELASVSRPRMGSSAPAVYGLTDGPAGPLALGAFFGQDLGSFRLWRSADGMTWETTPLPKGKDVIWATVAGLPDGYLLVGQRTNGRPFNWRSTDGVTWERLADSPRMTDVAVASDGTVVGVGQNDVWRTTDLATWESVWTTPDTWALDGQDGFAWVDWGESGFVVAGFDYSECAEGVDECQRNPLFMSVDGLAWSESTGPDGELGADGATYLTGATSLGDTLIVLGQLGGEPPSAWYVPTS